MNKIWFQLNLYFFSLRDLLNTIDNMSFMEKYFFKNSVTKFEKMKHYFWENIFTFLIFILRIYFKLGSKHCIKIRKDSVTFCVLIIVWPIRTGKNSTPPEFSISLISSNCFFNLCYNTQQSSNCSIPKCHYETNSICIVIVMFFKN